MSIYYMIQLYIRDYSDTFKIRTGLIIGLLFPIQISIIYNIITDEEDEYDVNNNLLYISLIPVYIVSLYLIYQIMIKGFKVM